MKPYLYPFRLYYEDDQNRKSLVRFYTKKRRLERDIDFSVILRELMAEKVASLSRPTE